MTMCVVVASGCVVVGTAVDRMVAGTSEAVGGLRADRLCGLCRWPSESWCWLKLRMADAGARVLALEAMDL